MIEVVYAKGDMTQADPLGGLVVVRRGQVWPAADPFVREHRAMFSADPRWGLTFTTQPEGWDDPPIAEDQAPDFTGEPVRGRRARIPA